VRVGFIHWLETVNSLLVKDFVALEQSRVNAQKSMEHLRAYMRVKNALRSKYLEANKFLESNMTRFALKYGITIESESTRLGERLLSANAALDYYEEIYLRFFAVKAHDKALNKAVNAKNVELIKALRSQQMDQCKQFVSELSKLSNYKGSPELKQAGIAVISSFEQTADKYGRLTYDLFAAEHQFDSLKTAVVSKPANERTNDEILAYNNAVKSYNSKVQAFEPQTQQYNLLRQKALKSWNEAVRNFSENYIK
jgi:hypothetical protein